MAEDTGQLSTETETLDTEATDTTVTDETVTTTDTTVMGGDGEDTVITSQADWPEDWRDRMAGTDEAFRKRLDRFASPMEVGKSFVNVEKQWKQGADPEPFPLEGTDEEKTKWRTDHGHPAAPADYSKTLLEGMTIGEADEGWVSEYYEMAHAENMPPEQVAKNLDHYFKVRERESQERTAQDLRDRDETQGGLREEFGKELPANLTAAKAIMEDGPDGMMDMIFSARLANGKQLGSDPEIVRWMIRTALKVNPAATVVPGTDTATGAATISKEMAELEKMMADTKGEYYQGAMAETHQARYRELLEAKERIDARKR